jgi:acyl carrier protein
MSDNIEQRIKEIMADILQLDRGKIGESTSADTTPKWDSTNHISLVLALERSFSIDFHRRRTERWSRCADTRGLVSARPDHPSEERPSDGWKRAMEHGLQYRC